MVLTLDNAGALVPGVKAKEESMEMKTVKVLRGFFDGKNSLKPGDIVSLPIGLAAQAKDARKVEFLPEEPKPAEAKMGKTEPAKALSVHPEELKPEARAETKEEPKEDPKKSKKV